MWPSLFKPVIVLLAIAAIVYAAIAGIVYFKQRSFLYFPSQEIRKSAPGFQTVKFRTNDGLTLAAGYHAAQVGRPTLLAFHGNAADWQSMAHSLRPLIDRGYGVLSVEYRGYQGNPGNPSEVGIYEDGRAALRWLGSNGVPPGQVVAVGNSLGSGVAVQLATETPMRALVLVSPMSSMVRLASAQMSWLPVNLLLRDRYDNLAKLPVVEVPIMILHGGSDTVIPIREGRMLASRNRAAILVEFPRVGHELMYDPVVESSITRFLREIPNHPTQRQTPAGT